MQGSLALYTKITYNLITIQILKKLNVDAYSRHSLGTTFIIF